MNYRNEYILYTTDISWSWISKEASFLERSEMKFFADLS